MTRFIGRTEDLAKLDRLLKKSTASLVVVWGRRRIGKSTLIKKFGEKMRFLKFEGLPPHSQTSKQTQLEEFGRQLGRELDQPPFNDKDWGDYFLRLASHTRKGRVIILLDELSWMGSKDPDFLGKLKSAWDNEFIKNPELILVLCSSVSWWMEENIIKSTAFMGRRSLELPVKELALNEINEFWNKTPKGYVSAYEKFKIISVTGGVPKYLEEVVFSQTAEQNIKDLCFDKTGYLFKEFDKIFSDLFNKKSLLYKSIVEKLVDGPRSIEELSKALKIERGGTFFENLESLCTAGFITRDRPWSLVDPKKESKLSQYRLSDNYTRFYLKYIDPLKSQIEKGPVKLPSWESIMGLQFENMVLMKHQELQEQLKIDPGNAVRSGPYFQRRTKNRKGCQIDNLIQTNLGTLYVCEVKFSKNPIGMEVIEEMKKKIDSLEVANYTSIRPVLVHVNGITNDLERSGYFTNIVDFSRLLNPDERFSR
jgi:hypothetical protein